MFLWLDYYLCSGKRRHSIYLYMVAFLWVVSALNALMVRLLSMCVAFTGQSLYTDRSKAVLLLWFLTVTCSCCPVFILWFSYYLSDIF